MFLFCCFISQYVTMHHPAHHITELETGRHARCFSIFVASTASLRGFVQPVFNTIGVKEAGTRHLSWLRSILVSCSSKSEELNSERSHYIVFIWQTLLSNATSIPDERIGSKPGFSAGHPTPKPASNSCFTLLMDVNVSDYCTHFSI